MVKVDYKPDAFLSMVANELRLGNYVESLNGFIVKVCMIESSQVCVAGEKLPEPVVSAYDYVKPIRITTQILENSGFSVLEKEDEHPIYLHSHLGATMYIEYNASSTYSFCLSTDDGQFIDVIRSFRYVHELQNIFFALTGYELQIEFDKENEDADVDEQEKISES